MENKSVKKQAAVLVVGIIAFAFVLMIPAPEGMSIAGQRMLAIVTLMAIWWIGEGAPITVTALLPLALFPLMGIMSSSEVAPNYGNHLVFLFLGGFMIALAMEKWSLHKRIALHIITKIGSDLPRIVLGFMVASAFLSMWISNTATTMMMLPVGMAVVKQVAAGSSLLGVRNSQSEQTIQSELGLVLMLGLAYSASIGGVATLIGTPPNIVFAGFYKSLYPELKQITFFSWMVMALPLVCVFLPLVWLYLCRYVSRFPLRHIEFGPEQTNIMARELSDLGKITRPERIIALVFFCTAVLWLSRQPIVVGSIVIPGWSQLFPHPEQLHDATVAMAMGLLLMLIPVNFSGGVELKGLREHFMLDWPTVQQRVPWGTLLLFGGGFALAAGFAKTGLDQWIGLQLTGLSALPISIIILVVCLVITFMTELTSNTATTTMILPIIGAAAVAASFHPLMLMIPATLSASFAFMLPVATPPNAIVHGSGWVSIARMSRAGLLLNFLGAVLISAMVLFTVEQLYL